MPKNGEISVIERDAKLSILKRGYFKIAKPNFTKRTSGLIKRPHIDAEKILSEYETTGGKH